MQIVHAGGQTGSEWTGMGLVGPSKLVHPAFGEEVEALTRAVKDVVACPVMVVGGFRSKVKVEEALDSIDAVAMSRPFIRQPDLANLWREGRTDRAECVSCGKCFSVGLKYGLGCGAI
jgi:2,4-dienoyl-CoA reductase-like NADH-dependent reductase (Old Yellow Enzyme family)